MMIHFALTTLNGDDLGFQYYWWLEVRTILLYKSEKVSKLSMLLSHTWTSNLKVVWFPNSASFVLSKSWAFDYLLTPQVQSLKLYEHGFMEIPYMPVWTDFWKTKKGSCYNSISPAFHLFNLDLSPRHSNADYDSSTRSQDFNFKTGRRTECIIHAY